MGQDPLAGLELDTHAHDTDAGGGHVFGTIKEINIMLPFLNFGGLGGFGGLFGIFFVINLIFKLLTGGLTDLFPTMTTM